MPASRGVWQTLEKTEEQPKEKASLVNGVAGVPGGLVGGPQDQFHGFKSHRVHARRHFFLHKKLISGKRESAS